MTDTQALVERLYVQFSDDGQHFRKWAREPFDGAIVYSFGEAQPGPGMWVPGEQLIAAREALERMAAEVEKANATVRQVQAAAKTIMIGEADELARLRAQAQEHHLAIKTLDSEREANALLTEENEKLRDLLVRARDIISGVYVNWHDQAQRALGGGEK